MRKFLLLCPLLGGPAAAGDRTFNVGAEVNNGRHSFNLGYATSPNETLNLFVRRVYSNDFAEHGMPLSETALGVESRYTLPYLTVATISLMQRQSRITAHYIYTDTNTAAYDITVKQTDYAANFGLASQWNWESIYVAVQWIAYERRLVKAGSTSLDRPLSTEVPLIHRFETKDYVNHHRTEDAIIGGIRIGWVF